MISHIFLQLIHNTLKYPYKLPYKDMIYYL